MNKQAYLEEIYNESFNDELEKVAKPKGVSETQWGSFKNETKKYNEKVKKLQKNAPFLHRSAPGAGFIGGAATGGAISGAIMRKSPFLGGMALPALTIAGGVGGALLGSKAIKKTQYAKDFKGLTEEYRGRVKKIENKK